MLSERPYPSPRSAKLTRVFEGCWSRCDRSRPQTHPAGVTPRRRDVVRFSAIDLDPTGAAINAPRNVSRQVPGRVAALHTLRCRWTLCQSPIAPRVIIETACDHGRERLSLRLIFVEGVTDEARASAR